MDKFKLKAIETNIEVYPPIFKDTIYDGVGEVTSYYQGHPPSTKYTIEVEEYDTFITWGSPNTVIKRYDVPSHLFVKIEEEKEKCECGEESSWQYHHRRSCPPNKHSWWCKLYKA